MVPSLQTLFMPLEQDAVPVGVHTVFLHADTHPMLRSLPGLTCVQPFRPAACRLESTGLSVATDVQGISAYDLAIVNIPKQVEEAQFALASALKALTSDGWIVAGAANDANGARLEKWLSCAGLKTTSLSKNKTRTVWAQRPDTLPEIVQSWHTGGKRRPVDFGDGIKFESQPGVFSWDRLDVGTAFLIDNVPGRITGFVADFGSGIGLLSRGVLAKNNVTALHLIDADARALDCALQNIADVQGACAVHTHWADLTAPVSGLPALDAIVMNPPFHMGKLTDAGLGQAFVRTAHHHLKKGGRLFMVANAHLPYEKILKGLYASVRPLAQDHGFKVLEAVK